MAACRQILENVGEAERHASGEYGAPKGELVISAPVSFSRTHLLPLLVEFLAAYPDIQVQLSQTDRAVNLLEENVDLAVRLASLPDSSLIAIRVGLIRRVLCASDRYLERRGTPQVPEDLLVHDCIASEATHSRDWRFTKSGTNYDVPITHRLRVTTAETAMDRSIGTCWYRAFDVLSRSTVLGRRAAAGGARRIRAATASVESGLFQPAAGAAETSRFLRFRNAKIARNLGVSVRLRLKIFEVTQQSASGNGADDLTGCSTAETGLR